MDWDASFQRMENLRNSIRPIQSGIPLRQILAEDFPRDCAALPISGGWGYSQSEAILFVRQQFPRPASPDFVSLEYHIAQKIIYEELIIFREVGSRFSGINLTKKSRRVKLFFQDLRTETISRHFPRIFGGVVRLRRQKPQENNEEIGQSRFLGTGFARPKKRRCVSPNAV